MEKGRKERYKRKGEAKEKQNRKLEKGRKG